MKEKRVWGRYWLIKFEFSKRGKLKEIDCKVVGCVFLCMYDRSINEISGVASSCLL